MKKISFPLILLVSMSLLIVAGASIYALPQGVTGYSQSGCTPCHGNNPGANTTVTISGLPEAYEPSQSYLLTVIVTSTVPSSDGGFDLSVTAGALVVTDPVNTELSSGELIHTDLGWHQRSWSFNWTAPTSGDVTFYVAGFAGDGTATGTGEWATYDHTLSIIPEFTGLTLLLVLAGITVIILFLARKRLPRLSQQEG